MGGEAIVVRTAAVPPCRQWAVGSEQCGRRKGSGWNALGFEEAKNQELLQQVLGLEDEVVHRHFLQLGKPVVAGLLLPAAKYRRGYDASPIRLALQPSC